MTDKIIATYSSRRWPVVTALSVMLILPLLLDLFVLEHRNALNSENALYLLLLVLLTIGPLYGIYAVLSAKRLSISVESEGVTVLKEGRRIRYDFSDLDAVRTPVVDQRSQAKILKLVRKGELVDRDGPVGGIYGNFGTDPTQIAATIKAAKDAWANRAAT